jgi:hypothetical protein
LTLRHQCAVAHGVEAQDFAKGLTCPPLPIAS